MATRSDGSPAVKAGYKIARDERALSENERRVMGQLAMGLNISATGVALGLSRQRVHQLVKALEKKGYVERDGRALKIIVSKETK